MRKAEKEEEEEIWRHNKNPTRDRGRHFLYKKRTKRHSWRKKKRFSRKKDDEPQQTKPFCPFSQRKICLYTNVVVWFSILSLSLSRYDDSRLFVCLRVCVYPSGTHSDKAFGIFTYRNLFPKLFLCVLNPFLLPPHNFTIFHIEDKTISFMTLRLFFLIL